jgi:hypothetical protein
VQDYRAILRGSRTNTDLACGHGISKFTEGLGCF